MRFPDGVLLVGLALALSAGGASGQRAATAERNVRLHARVLAMADARRFDRAIVDSALATGFAPLRAAAALAVGQTGQAGMPGAALLRELLGDTDVTVAANAAYALGLLRDSASVPVLAASLGGRARVASEAAWALGEIGAPAAEAIVAGLARRTSDETRTVQLLLAAAKLRPIPIESVRPYLRGDEWPSARWAASYVIARTRTPAGVRDVLALAANPAVLRAAAARSSGQPGAAAVGAARTADAYLAPSAVAAQRTRAEIARALAKSAAGDSLADLAVPALVRLAADPHPHVRINAVRSLATYAGRQRDVVVAATRDRDANVRIAAAQSLATVLDSSAVLWTALWTADSSFAYRSSILASALRAGMMLPHFERWQGHRDWRYRAAALAAASGLPGGRLARELGLHMIADSDRRVRSAAISAIAGSDTSEVPADARRALLAGLADPDWGVRAAAIAALSRRASAADLPAVLDSYDRALSDSSSDARIAAIRYLAAAWRRDSLAFTPQLRERVATLRVPADPLVRSQAAGLALLSGWQAHQGTSSPLEWYEAVVRTILQPAQRGSIPRVTIRTTRGDVVLELYAADAPLTVRNFLSLARSGFYSGTRFHRVVPNFVAQDGDPRGDGSGGPPYAIRDENNRRRYDRGTLGMALSGPDTGGSQYFITHSPQPHLDGHYTVFGRVVRGLDVLDSIVQGDAISAVIVR